MRLPIGAIPEVKLGKTVPRLMAPASNSHHNQNGGHMKLKTICAAGLTLLVGACAHQHGGQPGMTGDHFGVKEVGSFHVGGR